LQGSGNGLMPLVIGMFPVDKEEFFPLFFKDPIGAGDAGIPISGPMQDFIKTGNPL
jgi:hypothetical protein